MNSIEISLWVSEYRFKALEDTLRKQGAGTIEEKLRETFDTLYQEHVPDEQRAQIEARIEQEDAAEQAKLEANRRFAVYHIREDDEDFLFTNDYYQTPMQAAHRYRLYDRGELSSRPESFAGRLPGEQDHASGRVPGGGCGYPLRSQDHGAAGVQSG